jgi:hypothetical protein
VEREEIGSDAKGRQILAAGSEEYVCADRVDSRGGRRPASGTHLRDSAPDPVGQRMQELYTSIPLVVPLG